MTCTPYGINSHRLLVRGKRTENPSGLSEDKGKTGFRPAIAPAAWILVILGTTALIVVHRTMELRPSPAVLSNSLVRRELIRRRAGKKESKHVPDVCEKLTLKDRYDIILLQKIVVVHA